MGQRIILPMKGSISKEGANLAPSFFWVKVLLLPENGALFNIGSGVDISVGEIIDKVAKILDKEDIKIITDEARIRPEKSEVGMLRADHTHLKESTGWQPQFNYEKGLGLTVEWIRQHLDMYKPGVYNI